MSSDLAAALLGLASAASWGAGDFSGGLAAKRSPLLGVLALGQATGTALIAALAIAAQEAAPPLASLGWSMAAGVSGAVGLAALYRGLAIGRMAVVAPVSAVLCAALPVAWGALSEGLPPATKLLGFALALGGIFLVARSGETEDAAPGVARQGLLLALVAGAGFGGFLVFMHLGAEGGTFWPLAAARGTAFLLVLATALSRRSATAWIPARAALPLVLLSGALDAGGNALFVLASQAGRLDVAAVTSSMYPASTVVLAAVLLGERVSRPQGFGIAAVLGAIALIAG
jgi:drug/metabolite transporter (DMT)-like permease